MPPWSGGTRATKRCSGRLRCRCPAGTTSLNALAAIGVALELGAPFAVIARALGEFRGAERRFERKGEVGRLTVVDDYGHHPTEIAAVLRAARATAAGGSCACFSRTGTRGPRGCSTQFGPALSLADEIVLTDIYAAGEDPIPGATIEGSRDARRTGRAGPRAS